MLSLRDVHAHYGKSHVLHGVTIDVAPGEVVGLLGRNGVGKSTTLKTIMGLVRASAGSVTFEGSLLAPAEAVTQNSYLYTARYRFRVGEGALGSCAVSPSANISSGGQVKHTDSNAWGSLAPLAVIPPATAVPTATSTGSATPTSSATATATASHTATASSTSTASATRTATASATRTATGTATQADTATYRKERTEAESNLAKLDQFTIRAPADGFI